MGLSFQVETLSAIEDELRGLLHFHWEEVALDKHAIKLKPDWDAYHGMEKLGVLHIMTVRDEGTLIGYFLSIVRPHMHYLDSLTAMSDIFYVHPKYRAGRTALRLFVEVEKALRERGVQKLYVTHKLHVNDIGNLLFRLGYRHIENVNVKLLQENS